MELKKNQTYLNYITNLYNIINFNQFFCKDDMFWIILLIFIYYFNKNIYNNYKKDLNLSKLLYE
jgi:hypothetical protein